MNAEATGAGQFFPVSIVLSDSELGRQAVLRENRNVIGLFKEGW